MLRTSIAVFFRHSKRTIFGTVGKRTRTVAECMKRAYVFRTVAGGSDFSRAACEAVAKYVYSALLRRERGAVEKNAA